MFLYQNSCLKNNLCVPQAVKNNVEDEKMMTTFVVVIVRPVSTLCSVHYSPSVQIYASLEPRTNSCKSEKFIVAVANLQNACIKKSPAFCNGENFLWRIK